MLETEDSIRRKKKNKNKQTKKKTGKSDRVIEVVRQGKVHWKVGKQ